MTRLNPTKSEVRSLDPQLPVSFVPMEAVGEFIEGWYNPHRRHSALGYRSPIAYERLLSEAA